MGNGNPFKGVFGKKNPAVRGGEEEYEPKPIRISKKKATRVLAAVGVFLYCYLSGLIGQVINNYRAYQAAGGLFNREVELEPTKFGVFTVMKHLFTSGGIAAFVGLGIVAGLIYFVIRYYGNFFGKDYDERGFKKSRTGAYGTADWMTEKEKDEVLETTYIEDATGTILGLDKNGKAVSLPIDTRLNRHVMVFGASGTRKTRSYARPFAFQAIRRGESLAITDPKGELYTDLYEILIKNGYNVKVYNLVNPEHGNSWNCMSNLGGDTLMADVLANVIIGNTSTGKGDQFWDNGEKNLLKALILLVDSYEEDGITPVEKNLSAVYRKLTECSQRDLDREFERLPQGHPAKGPYGLFAQSSDQVKSGMILGLGTRLQILQNKAVQDMVSGNDIDLAALGKEKTAFFVILSDQDSTMKFLASLFFSLMFIQLTRYADAQPNHKCAVPVNLLLDEFNNVGRIGGAEDGSDFARTLSVIRSRDVRVSIIVQSLGQLQNRYANNLWAEIVGNCDIQLLLGCTDDLTAEYVSNRSGDMSITVESTRHSRKTIAVAQMIPEYQKTEGEGSRKLLTPDEVLRLDGDDLLVIIRGYNLLRLKKMDFTEHPMSEEIVPRNIMDYWPRLKINPETGEIITPAEVRKGAEDEYLDIPVSMHAEDIYRESEVSPGSLVAGGGRSETAHTERKETPPTAGKKNGKKNRPHPPSETRSNGLTGVPVPVTRGRTPKSAIKLENEQATDGFFDT